MYPDSVYRTLSINKLASWKDRKRKQNIRVLFSVKMFSFVSFADKIWLKNSEKNKKNAKSWLENRSKRWRYCELKRFWSGGNLFKFKSDLKNPVKYRSFQQIFHFYFHITENVCLCYNQQHVILTLKWMRNAHPMILKGNTPIGTICQSIYWRKSSRIWRSSRNITQVWWVCLVFI